MTRLTRENQSSGGGESRPVRTRFAPSPTGVLHLGSIRTALFSWLFARHHGGQFVLRIEDTDAERSTHENVEAILDGMAWLRMDYDEGPYFQTQRYDRYRELVGQLLDEGKAYRCYCTKEELSALRAAQLSKGEKVGYDGRCSTRTEPRPGVEPVVRLWCMCCVKRVRIIGDSVAAAAGRHTRLPRAACQGSNCIR